MSQRARLAPFTGIRSEATVAEDMRKTRVSPDESRTIWEAGYPRSEQHPPADDMQARSGDDDHDDVPTAILDDWMRHDPLDANDPLADRTRDDFEESGDRDRETGHRISRDRE